MHWIVEFESRVPGEEPEWLPLLGKMSKPKKFKTLEDADEEIRKTKRAQPQLKVRSTVVNR